MKYIRGVLRSLGARDLLLDRLLFPIFPIDFQYAFTRSLRLHLFLPSAHVEHAPCAPVFSQTGSPLAIQTEHFSVITLAVGGPSTSIPSSAELSSSADFCRDGPGVPPILVALRPRRVSEMGLHIRNTVSKINLEESNHPENTPC
jgi:hypothetical protein